MKNLCKLIFGLAIIFSFLGCNDYLDIVPDRTQEVSLMFERKDAAYTALVTCYSYLPQNDDLYGTFALASDEITTPFAKEPNSIKLMKGEQNADDPIMNYWSGYGGGKYQGSLWDGIRSCNLLIDNINNVVDMDQEEKNSWAAEAKLLKAYYHFLLAIHYGPIPIVDSNLSIDSSDEELRVFREPVDDVFAYILQTIDNAVIDLPKRVLTTNDLGRMDQVIAYALKSKVTLHAASPLFNGNSEYYSDFIDHKGNPFFNQNIDVAKWEVAALAAESAISIALEQGISMFSFSETPSTFDSTNYRDNLFYRTLYDLKYSIIDPWNSELIWGDSSPVNSWWRIQSGALMKNPTASSVEAAWQWLSPTLRIAELFYTKNGLPIDEDLDFDYENRYEVVRVERDQSQYARPFNRTVRLHLNREPRFYSSLGFDTGQYRAWGELWNLSMRKGQTHGRIAQTSDYLITGYALKKLVHPDSEGDTYDKVVRYPWPNSRLAELYLNYAEAMNEAYGPSQEIYDALNVVRERAGIPHIETIWSDATIVKTPNKHTTKDGLRQIIQQERMIELAFEGHRYNDIRRWKLADEYFNTPVFGWSVDESSEAAFYQTKQVGLRSFLSPRDYLHPIKTSELTTNPNLIQNPNW